MLKIIVVLFMLIYLRINVYGEIRYSEYTNFSDWQEEEVEKSDLVDVEIEKRYKWYKVDKIEGTYSIENNNNIAFPYIDRNDYIIKEFPTYSIEKPALLPNRIIEEKMFYRYRHIYPIKYIHIMNVHSDFGKFGISELNIFIDNEKVDYNFNCGYCSVGFGTYINDNNIYQDNVYIGLDKTLTIDLNGYYDANRIKIDMYLYDPLLALKQYEIVFSPYPAVTRPQYFYKKNISYFFTNNIFEVKLFSHKIDQSWLKDVEWSDWNYSENYIGSSFSWEVEPQLLYRYKDTFYRYYKINKVYFNHNYYANVPGVEYKYKDIEQYKTFYRYRIRTILDNEDDGNNKDEQNVNIDNNEVINNDISYLNEGGQARIKDEIESNIVNDNCNANSMNEKVDKKDKKQTRSIELVFPPQLLYSIAQANKNSSINNKILGLDGGNKFSKISSIASFLVTVSFLIIIKRILW